MTAIEIVVTALFVFGGLAAIATILKYPAQMLAEIQGNPL